MTTYVFDEGVVAIRNHKRADPQKIGTALQKIRRKHDGLLKPRYVWKDAEGNVRHPLYKFFEWKDEDAAAQWRDQQARVLINSIVVVDDDGETAPAYFSIVQKRKKAYYAHEDVMRSKDLQKAVLLSARRDLDAWKQRYNRLKEVCVLVDPASRQLSKMIEEEDAHVGA